MTTRIKGLVLAGLTSTAALFSSAANAVEIEYWQYFFDARVTAMEQLIENFEAANPDITVTMTHFPYADYRTKVAAAIPAGEGPDVVQLFYGWLNDYVAANLIQPLPADTFPASKIDSEFFPMVQAMKDGDAYWALPTAVRSLALFYNTRLLEEAGVEPPTNMEEFLAAAAAMTKRDGAGNITQVGITAGMTAQDHHWFREGLVRQMGGEPYANDYKTVNYNSEAGVQALEFYTDLFMSDEPVSAIGFMDEPQAAFKAGRAGMHIDGSFRIGSLNKTRGLKWGVTELPATGDGVRSNYSSYWVNAITTKAEGEKYDASVKFMEYITSDEAMQIWLDVVGELPAKPSVGLTEENANNEVFGPFIKGLAYANTTKFANESAQRQLMVEMVERIQLQGMSPAESIAIAAEAEQKLLDEYYSK
ncbi:extracellular solute-binding protein [Shimia abyssi]|uniref:Carbohydrate ABC transporter substrate-binding protein (CUT1 family) n=1 Tax=Shimia abyssi TaxID=1662395 RepID=A0A2P8FEI2_9RHOB|nr:extracellular solute-binding protein [Shimia abyssi]PSL20094.1 carbohydrate ABC transporter substrate-binding protein (CUT1 family) [Shimia abyssi]